MLPARSLFLTVLSAFVLCAAAARAQVFTVSTEQIEGRFLQFQPTHVELPRMHAGPFTYEGLQRTLASEQGYAMRPLPLASKGLVLIANGALTPNGSDYVTELNSKGISARPGDRVTVTRIVFNKDRLVLEFNGGPDLPHKYLRHLQVGAGGGFVPVARDNGEQATGSRLTLIFAGGVPNVTGDEVKALIAPVVGFGEKSPLEAYVETLPPFLKKAILDHRVLVGMDRDMVLHALGSPVQKVRERDESRPFEEWIYGTPPEKTQFVRLQGNRVIRVEEAAVGTSPVVRSANEVGNYWETQADGGANVRLVQLGDRSESDRAAQNAPTTAPPTLRKPGETLPADKNPQQPSMGPVQFPPGTGTGAKSGTGTGGASGAGTGPATGTPDAGHPPSLQAVSLM